MPPACPCCAKADAEYSRTDSVSSEALKRFIRVILLYSISAYVRAIGHWLGPLRAKAPRLKPTPKEIRIQCVVGAACVSELQIHVAIRVGADPCRISIILRYVGASRSLLASFEHSSVGRIAGAPGLPHDFAEHRLLAGRQNVVSRRAHTDELPQVEIRTALEVTVEAQRGVGSDENL